MSIGSLADARTHRATDLSVADILDRAADLVEPEGAWTQGPAARNAAGKSVPPHSSDAVCWCLFGAVYRVAGGLPDGDVWRAVKAGPAGSVPVEFNEAPGRTQAEVVAALRQAAEKARQAVSS